MLGFARRLLDLNDAALAAVQGPPLAGHVRLGLPQDFAETHLPQVLARFARLHPGVRVDARVERDGVLRTDLETGVLDLALLWQEGAATRAQTGLLDLPMVWIGPRDWRRGQARDLSGAAPVPVVAFEAPCLFRAAALGALDGAGLPWAMRFGSPSLSGLWAAVSAGLGVTVRIPLGLPAALAPLDPADAGLPPLPRLRLVLARAAPTSHPAADRLAATLTETFAQVAAPLSGSMP